MKVELKDFQFDKDETKYESILLPMWIDYMREIEEEGNEEQLFNDLQKRLEISTKIDNIHFDMIWCENNAIGFVFYSIDGGIKNIIPPGYGYIMELYILPAWRRRNVASYVVSDLCKYYKEEGCEKVYLTSYEGSVEFWLKQNFIKTGLTDPDNQMWIYIKELKS